MNVDIDTNLLEQTEREEEVYYRNIVTLEEGDSSLSINIHSDQDERKDSDSSEEEEETDFADSLSKYNSYPSIKQGYKYFFNSPFADDRNENHSIIAFVNVLSSVDVTDIENSDKLIQLLCFCRDVTKEGKYIFFICR